MEFTFFNKFRNINSKREIHITELVDQIRTSTELKDRITILRELATNGTKLSAQKLDSGLKSLPAYTPGCLLYIKDRTAILSHNDFAATDLVHVQFTSEKSRADLSKNEHVLMVYSSPLSGLTVLFKVKGIRTSSDYESAYGTILDYCEDQGYEDIVDSENSNISSPVHLSFDPSLTLNEEAVPLSFELAEPEIDFGFGSEIDLGDRAGIFLDDFDHIIQEEMIRIWQEFEGDEPSLFNRTDKICRINSARKQIEFVSEQKLNTWLSERFYFIKKERKGDKLVIKVPIRILSALHDRGASHIPELKMLYEHPIILPDHECANDTGYYSGIESYIFNQEGFDWNELDSSSAGIQAAKDLLFNDLLYDFPFKDDESLANYMAYFLTFPMRPAISGNVPFFGVTASTPGTGKTTLLNMTSMIWCNKMPGSVQISKNRFNDQEEMRKRLTSILSESEPRENIVITNIVRDFDDPVVASALTDGIYEDRRLGVSEMVRTQFRSIMAGTGNNLTFDGDMSRRYYMCDLETDMARPETKEDYKHDILPWSQENRIRLISAAMTLIKSWIENEAPLSKQYLGSFEHWTRIIGGILENANIDGFDVQHSRPTTTTYDLLHDFCISIYDERGADEFTTAEIFDNYVSGDEPQDKLLDVEMGTGNLQSKKIRFGKFLTANAGRYFEQYRLIKLDKKSGNKILFQVISADSEEKKPDPVLLPETNDDAEPAIPF